MGPRPRSSRKETWSGRSEAGRGTSRWGGAALHDDEDARRVTVLSDDERPFVIYDAGPEMEPPDDRAA